MKLEKVILPMLSSQIGQPIAVTSERLMFLPGKQFVVFLFQNLVLQ